MKFKNKTPQQRSAIENLKKILHTNITPEGLFLLAASQVGLLATALNKTQVESNNLNWSSIRRVILIAIQVQRIGVAASRVWNLSP